MQDLNQRDSARVLSLGGPMQNFKEMLLDGKVIFNKFQALPMVSIQRQAGDGSQLKLDAV